MIVMKKFEEIYSSYRDSELIQKVVENRVETYPVYSEDLQLINHILKNENVDDEIKSRLLKIGSGVDDNLKKKVMENFSIDSIDSMDSLIGLINSTIDSNVKKELLSWLINSNELTIFYLEETGKISKNEHYLMIREILSQIKLSLNFKDFTEVLNNSAKNTMSYIKEEYLEDVKEEYLRLILPRIEEIEEILWSTLELYIQTIERELIESPNLELYQIITKFVDLIFTKLPTDKFPEYDSCPEEEFEDYKDVIEMMYTQFSLKLMNNTISSFSKF